MTIQIKRILHPTDFSESAEQALHVAVKLARLFGSELHVLRVAPFRKAQKHDPLAHLEDPALVKAHLEADALKAIEETLDRPEAADLQIEPVFRSGVAPGPTLVDYTEDEDIDLVVMGTHGRRGLNHMMLGSVAEEVVRRAPCPVLTVRAGEEPISTDWKRILVPLDFSDHSHSALATARGLAVVSGAALEVLHVVEPLRSMGLSNYGHEITRNWEASQSEAAEELMQKAWSDLGEQNVERLLKTVIGKPAHAIPTVAEADDADLIVIATHGRTGLKRFFLGSVAEKVVRHTQCPVLTVKAFGRSLLKADGRSLLKADG